MAAAIDDVRGCVFVNAGLPTPGRSWFETAPAELADHLRGMAREGWLPPWSEWWGPDALADLVPDTKARARFTAGCPPLPLGTFEETNPKAPGWQQRARAYLRVSEAYQRPAEQARDLGWAVFELSSHHLAVLAEPGLVVGPIARPGGPASGVTRPIRRWIPFRKRVRRDNGRHHRGRIRAGTAGGKPPRAAVSLLAMQERGSSAPQWGPGERLHAASWSEGGIVFEHGRLAAPRIDTLSSSTSTHRLVLTETGGTSRTHISVNGRTVYDGFDRPGVLTFIPASAERRSSYWDADLTYSCIWITPALLDSLSGTPELSPLQAEVNRGDDVVGALLRSLRSAVALAQPPAAVYVEHLAALALLRMAAMPPGAPAADRSSRLDRKALDCAFAYVDAHLASDIRLSELAALTGLPTDTFARRFRASVGQPPYRYVLGRRVERAGQLLRETDTSISVVALATGFSSQSHLTSVFKHLTGTTPRAYRREQRPGS